MKARRKKARQRNSREGNLTSPFLKKLLAYVNTAGGRPKRRIGELHPSEEHWQQDTIILLLLLLVPRVPRSLVSRTKSIPQPRKRIHPANIYTFILCGTYEAQTYTRRFYYKTNQTHFSTTNTLRDCGSRSPMHVSRNKASHDDTPAATVAKIKQPTNKHACKNKETTRSDFAEMINTQKQPRQGHSTTGSTYTRGIR